MVMDVLIDERAEMLMRGRDIMVGEAAEQVCSLLAESSSGEWRLSPLSGWDLGQYVGCPASELRRVKPSILEDLKRNKIEAKVAVNQGEIIIEL